MPGVTSKKESIGFLPLDVHRLVAADERPCPRLCYIDFLPANAASAYSDELRSVLGKNGRFDLITLGMGADGHTASLFPGSATLEEKDALAISTYVEALGAWRVTLTLPTINASRNVLFLVSGPEKARALARVLSGGQLLADLINPSAGEISWYVDRVAASLLQRETGNAK